MSDKRFDKVFSDPRFMVAPKKVSKVKIDKRFEGMFKEKSFNVIAKVDKYGRKINKKDTHALQNYYTGKDDGESGSGSDSDPIGKLTKPEASAEEQDGSSDEESAGKKYYDEGGKFHWSGAESSGSSSDVDEAGEDGEKDASKKKQKK